MIESFLVNMTSFNKKRNIPVYSPKGYIHEQKAYPVLYMRDGQNVFHDEEVNGGPYQWSGIWTRIPSR